jgi:hypothetical protein
VEADDYRSALIAGIIPDRIQLPGGLVGTQRVVRISAERLHHVAERRPDWLLFCLLRAPIVLANPQFLGYRPTEDRRRVEFVRRVGDDSRLLLVAVKFLDASREAWVSTSHPLEMVHLTRRLRAGTMHEARRGP